MDTILNWKGSSEVEVPVVPTESKPPLLDSVGGSPHAGAADGNLAPSTPTSAVKKYKDPEMVSINRVDCEGNSAIHYAATNGLAECVERLVALGAIISLVNKAQKTCCDVADIGGFRELAHVLVGKLNIRRV
jgi:ankyrin repeat protein